VPAALEDPIEDGLRKVGVVQHPSPRPERLVRREEQGPAVQVAVVDDLEEHVGRVGAVAEIADLVDDEDVHVGIGRQEMAKLPLAGRAGEVIDEFRRRGEQRVEAVLDGAVGDGHDEMGLAGARRNSHILRGFHERSSFDTRGTPSSAKH